MEPFTSNCFNDYVVNLITPCFRHYLRRTSTSSCSVWQCHHCCHSFFMSSTRYNKKLQRKLIEVKLFFSILTLNVGNGKYYHANAKRKLSLPQHMTSSLATMMHTQIQLSHLSSKRLPRPAKYVMTTSGQGHSCTLFPTLLISLFCNI